MYYMSWSHWLSGTLKPVTSDFDWFLLDLFSLTVAFHGIFLFHWTFHIGIRTTKTEVLSEHAEMAKAAAEVRVLNLHGFPFRKVSFTLHQRMDAKMTENGKMCRAPFKNGVTFGIYVEFQ